MMNTGVIEFSNAEIEAENDAHFSFSAETNAGDAEQEYRKVKRIKTDSKMAKSLSEQLGEERTQILITSLPQELLTMIFSHLEANFLSTTVTNVCRYFHNVVKSEGFWKTRKTLYINEEESGIDFIMTVMSKCPKIRHLNVNFRLQGPEPSLTIPNMRFPYLRSLVMTNVNPRAENAVEMIVQGAPYLKVINLEGLTTVNMMEVLAPATELTTFSVHCKNEDEDILEYEPALTNIFKSYHKLETVHVQFFCSIDWDPLLTLLEACSETLKRLTWHGTVTDFVMEKLSTCPQISHLDISICITNESVKFFRSMKQIETLRLLSYEYDAFTNADYIEMFKGNAFPVLKHLSFLDCCEVDDKVLEVIGTNSKRLESLELYNANTTDMGIGLLIAHCSNLRALKLWEIKNLDYSFIKDLPNCCPHLHFLVLFHKPVPEPIIQEFLNTHPSFNIKKCEELKNDMFTYYNFVDFFRINFSHISFKPIVLYLEDFSVSRIIGHK